MGKIIMDRVFKTIMIVIDVIYGGIISLYSIAALFASAYSIQDSIPSFIMATAAIIVANIINVIIRKWIKTY